MGAAFVAVCLEADCTGRREFKDAGDFLRPPKGQRRPRCPLCGGPLRRLSIEELMAELTAAGSLFQRIHAMRVAHARLHRQSYLDSGD